MLTAILVKKNKNQIWGYIIRKRLGEFPENDLLKGDINVNLEKILAAVAAKHGVSVAEVRRDMLSALELAQNKADKTPKEQEMQNAVGVATGADLAEVLQGAAREIGKNVG